MKLYREVKADTRTPGEGEWMTNEGWLEYDHEDSEWMFLNSYAEYVIVRDVVWWLEPIEITEDEIHNIANEYLIIKESSCDSDYPYFTMKGAKAILSKLKGE